MELSTLRSRLSNASNELQSLTVADLTACKWPIRRRICFELFYVAPVLSEYAKALEEHIDSYEQKINIHRQQNGSREKKLEIDQSFKTAFMRSVLDGLSKLRWQPTLEAFSDPIGLLFGDKADFYSAILFLLDELFPIERMPSSSSNSRENADSQWSGKEVVMESTRFNSQRRPTSHCSSADGQVNKSMSSQSKAASALDTSVMSRPTIDSTLNESVLSMQADFGDISSIKISPRPQPLPQDSRQQLLDIIERLQYQNENLSKQMRTLQMAVAARDNAEAKMSLLFADFIAAIDEIVTISGSSSAAKTPVARDNPMVSKEEEPPREKTPAPLDSTNSRKNATQASRQTSKKQREAADDRINQQRDVSSSKEDNHSGEWHPPQGSSGVIWSKLKERVGGIYSQWTQSVRECRQVILRSFVKLHDSSREYLMNKTEARSTLPSSSCSSSGFGATPRDNRPSLDDSRSRKSTPQVSRHGMPTTSPQSGTKTAPQQQQQFPSVLIHRVLGIVVPLSWMSAAGESSFDGCSDWAGRQIGLDLSRIHMLQKDLIHFANSVNSVYSASYVRSDSTNRRFMNPQRQTSSSKGLTLDSNEYLFPSDPLPASSYIANQQRDLLQLLFHAQDLSLHLSSLAPLAPLTLSNDSPLKSYMTGLELIAEELAELSRTKGFPKQAICKLQAYCERALSEQTVCIRTLQCCRSCLQQWVNHALGISTLLDKFVANIQAIFQKCLSSLGDSSKGIGAIIQNFFNADASRVNVAGYTSYFSEALKSSAKKKSETSLLLNPMDILSKGHLGPETAGLINALKLYCASDMTWILTELKELENQIKTSVNNEIAELHAVKMNLINACETSSSI